MYNVAVRRVLVTLFAVHKQISITYSECVYVTLVVQHGMRMRHIKIAICVPYFSILFHKQRDFRKRKSVEHKYCFDFSRIFI